MELLLQRRPTDKRTTLGELAINGVPFCKTLEDVVREVAGQPTECWKVTGETAIPQGRYELELVNSGRFGPDTLGLKDVPGFDVIRIHSGNDDADTEGCILVGERVVADDDGGNIAESRAALARLKAVMLPILKGGQQAWLTIQNG